MHIFIDIETLPRELTPDEIGTIAAIETKIEKGDFAEFVNTSQWKKPETIAQKLAELGPERAQKAINEIRDTQASTGLKDLYGRILAVGIAIGEDERPQVFYDETGQDTKTLLRDLETYLRQRKARHGDKWIGYNLKTFDLPWLWHHALKYGCFDLARLIPKDKWGRDVVDIMEIWGGTDYRRRVKLNDIGEFLEGDSKEGLSGDMVWPLFQQGQHEILRDYCENDVQITRAIWRTLNQIGAC